ncbi:hypothetical protein R1flu_002626 [Riccia fluitans]|uniref:Uncharacterized protein n=1 Tax=Riccia fluitans TaxID=41844 RepID=A0ABD1Y6Q4_9MARC
MLWQQTHMGSIVANKSRVASDRVVALRERRDKLQTDLDQKHAMINEVKATVLRGEDLKNYVDTLRAKSAKYKEMKKEIADLDSEYGALLRNLELLEQQTDVQPQLSTELTFKLWRWSKQRRSSSTLTCAHSSTELAMSSKEYEDGKQKLKENTLAIEKLEVSQLQIQAEKENGSVSSKLNFKIEQQEELLKSVQHKQEKIKETEHINGSQMAMMKDLLDRC